ncbi:MAG TPA: hypothetical protein VIC25_04825 [Caulobacteraceae bacterium]
MPLTTPSVDLENKLFLNTITVLFDTHDSCWLMRTDVWDGQNLIQSFNHNWVDGDTNEATPSANNLLSFGSGYEISQAINVSLSFYVMFVGDQSGESVQVPQTSPRATIYAVGGKFGIPAAKPVSATVGRRASGFAKSP